MNVHLDDLFGQTRNKQINYLRPLISKFNFCILGGDLNQEYNKKSKLFDIDKMIVHNDKCISYYIENKMNIDNILTKGYNKTKQIECPYVPITRSDVIEYYGSDHLPITIDIIN